MDDLVLTSERDGLLLIELNRPSKRNAIDHDVTAALDAAMNRLEDDPALRAGILAGRGPAFSAGSDMYDQRSRSTARGGEYGVLRRRRTKPLVAAVEGAALGGGFELVLSCDLVVAGRDARFGLPETLRGLAATGGAVFRAPRALPVNLAAELLLTGQELSAERGHALGLVNRLVEPGQAVAAAVELAGQIRSASPAATAATLAALQAVRAGEDDTGWQATAAMKSAVLASPDAAEGRRAFAERRRPSWSAR